MEQWWNKKQDKTIADLAAKRKTAEEDNLELKKANKGLNSVILKLKENIPCPKKMSCPGADKCSYSHTLKDRTLELNTAHTEHHTQISSLLHDTDFKVSALQTHTSQ